ncbi:plasmid mobilization relaxosome protein MobC [Reichenbachiella sp.]|uniref:plasmid mobilization relaxosome protein MobC n=1 Tax=Reichenbachiella sp. TaxID=2184521 RepID=UPI0032982BA3
MARPKLKETEKKSRKKAFRCTIAELKMMNEYCLSHKVTVLHLVKVGMNKYQPPAKATVDKKLIFELSRIGSNINQIAKALHGKNRAVRILATARIREIEDVKKIILEMQNQIK